MTDGNWFQVILNSSQNIAYVREDVTKFLQPKETDISAAESKKIIDGLVNNDIQVHDHLVKSANILTGLKTKGVPVSVYEKNFKSLFDRFARRQEKIKNSKILKWQSGFKKGTQNLIDGFKAYVLLNTGIYISALPVAAVVISAVAGAGLSVLAYFAFRPEYDESKTDLVLSKELEETLSKLEPETARKIKDNLEQQIDKAYNTGKTHGTFSGAFKIIKPLAIAAAGFFLVTKFIEHQKKR
jgi:hypothetical protein